MLNHHQMEEINYLMTMSLSTPDLLASKDWYINLLDIPHYVTINHSEHRAWTDHTPGISALHLAFKMLSWNPSGSSGVLGISSTGLLDCVCLVTQVCPTLCDPTDSSPPGSSVHRDSPGKNTGVGCHALLQGIFLTRDRTQVSHIAGRFLTIWATREAWTSRLVPSNKC